MNDRINVLTQAEAWCNVLERAHVELVGSIVAIDAGSPGVRSQLEQAQRALAAAQLTHQGARASLWSISQNKLTIIGGPRTFN
jgi:hypothetical protein